jgi:DNA-directed RNA polymerase specialized sigma24 family protein
VVERRERRIKIIRAGGRGLINIDPREFVEEAELADGTRVIKIKVPRRKPVEGEESDALGGAAGVSSAIAELQSRLGELVRQARADGYTWTQIGAALGMSKQAAWERFSGED